MIVLVDYTPQKQESSSKTLSPKVLFERGNKDPCFVFYFFVLVWVGFFFLLDGCWFVGWLGFGFFLSLGNKL